MYKKLFYASGFVRILNTILIAVFIFSSAVNYNPRIVRAEDETTTSSEEGTPHHDDDDEDQITICHYPPGNPENAHTITIDESAWSAHQAHGDTLGPCAGNDGDDDEDGDDEDGEDTGSITVCKIIQDTEGATVAGDAGSTFTVPAWLDESYEGEAANPSESDAVFTTPLTLESIFGDVQGKCVTYDDLELGRYYYGEEEVSSGLTWQAPRYNDGATGVADSLSDLHEFNSGGDEANDDFDGVINLSAQHPSRTLLVLNTLADACPNLEGTQNFGANCEPEQPTTTVTATKIVCPDESMLPNWGDNGPSVTSTTATEFLATHEACHLEPWTFEWIDVDGTPSGHDAEGHVEGWTAFNSGVVTSVPAGQRLWFREQMQDGYIPFSGDTTNDPYDTVGAEFYCATDVLHYDNLEFIDTVEGNAYNCIGFNVPTEQSCEEDVSEMEIISDTTTEVNNNPSFLLTFIHAAWTAAIGGASWIWSTDPVVLVPDVNEVETFTKTFTIDGTPLGGNLMIAADNFYSVTLNGNPLCSDAGEFNYSAAGQDVCPISAEMLNSGENTITFTVTNMNLSGETTTNNPAGLLYKLTLNKNACVPPPTDVCSNIEGDQAEVPEGMQLVEGMCVPIQVDLPACSDGVDNSDEEDALVDAADPACHFDGNVNNPDSYTPDGTSESNESNQCSDGITNDDDGLIDSNDPGCHSDGDASNIDSWVPTDNDENNEVVSYACSDDSDNDGDQLVDSNDPGCHSDGDAANGGSYVPTDNDEFNETGGGSGGDTTPPPTGRHSHGGSSGSVPLGQVLGAQTSCGLTLDTYMRMHYYKNNSDKVKILQNFLNSYLKAGIVVDGKFGPITDRFVKAFQTKHADQILTPWKIGAPTGLVYKTTVRVINNIMCPELNLPIPTDLINWSENPALK